MKSHKHTDWKNNIKTNKTIFNIETSNISDDNFNYIIQTDSTRKG